MYNDVSLIERCYMNLKLKAVGITVAFLTIVAAMAVVIVHLPVQVLFGILFFGMVYGLYTAVLGQLTISEKLKNIGNTEVGSK